MRTAFVALLFMVAFAAADLAPLLGADHPNAINGSYIVVLNGKLQESGRDAHIAALDAAVRAAGDDSKVNHIYSIGSFIGYSATLSEVFLKRVLANPDVEYIEVDSVVSLFDAPAAPAAAAATITQTGATWGLTRISVVNLPLPTTYIYNNTDTSAVDVYVIDTGILSTHKDFGTRVTILSNSIVGESNEDLNGHGTHCAGTIGGTTYGVAKNVKLFAVKVLGASGSGTNAGVLAGVSNVTASAKTRSTRAAVASMSLGSSGTSTALNAGITASIAEGTIYAIAAGNDNSNACNYSPAMVAAGITVGATTNTDARASYSNFGTCVDVFAPGSAITSDYIGSSNTATSTLSGTSMATPHVAGVLALHLSYEKLTPTLSKKWLLDTATTNLVTNPGTGSPNRLLYSPKA